MPAEPMLGPEYNDGASTRRYRQTPNALSGHYGLYHATLREPYHDAEGDLAAPRMTAEEMALLRAYQPVLDASEPPLYPAGSQQDIDLMRAERLLQRLEAYRKRGY